MIKYLLEHVDNHKFKENCYKIGRYRFSVALVYQSPIFGY